MIWLSQADDPAICFGISILKRGKGYEAISGNLAFERIEPTHIVHNEVKLLFIPGSPVVDLAKVWINLILQIIQNKVLHQFSSVPSLIEM